MKRKITQYLRRAEEIFTCHLQRALGDGSPGGTVSPERGPRPRPRPGDAWWWVPHPGSPRPQGYSSLRLRPVRTLRSAVDNLRRCRVLALIDKVRPERERGTGGPGPPWWLWVRAVTASERCRTLPAGAGGAGPGNRQDLHPEGG